MFLLGRCVPPSFPFCAVSTVASQDFVVLLCCASLLPCPNKRVCPACHFFAPVAVLLVFFYLVRVWGLHCFCLLSVFFPSFPACVVSMRCFCKLVLCSLCCPLFCLAWLCVSPARPFFSPLLSSLVSGLALLLSRLVVWGSICSFTLVFSRVCAIWPCGPLFRFYDKPWARWWIAFFLWNRVLFEVSDLEKPLLLRNWGVNCVKFLAIFWNAFLMRNGTHFCKIFFFLRNV